MSRRRSPRLIKKSELSSRRVSVPGSASRAGWLTILIESAGMVLVAVSNATPDVATLRGAPQQSFVFRLTPESFAMGEFKFNLVLDASKTGTFVLKATAIPFLAPVKAQEFAAEASVAKN